MNYFYYRLNAPRPTFGTDMTAEEAQVMETHAVYWRKLMEVGKVILVGPVLDPRASFGIGILQLPEGEDPFPYGTNDPAITSGRGFTFEIHPMPKIMVPGA